MEAIRSSETSVLIRATRRHLPEDDNHHSHRRGNLKSYEFISIYIRVQSSGELMTGYIFTSSAKRRCLEHLINRHKSFIYTLKSRDSRTESCGTPGSTWESDEINIEIRTCNCLLVKWLWNQFILLAENPRAQSLWWSRVWRTRSEPESRSK
jgi:hypothetical protein